MAHGTHLHSIRTYPRKAVRLNFRSYTGQHWSVFQEKLGILLLAQEMASLTLGNEDCLVVYAV